MLDRALAWAAIWSWPTLIVAALLLGARTRVSWVRSVAVISLFLSIVASWGLFYVGARTQFEREIGLKTITAEYDRGARDMIANFRILAVPTLLSAFGLAVLAYKARRDG